MGNTGKLLITVKESADILGVSESLMRNTIRTNKELPSVKMGNKYYINRKSFLEWMEKNLGIVPEQPVEQVQEATLTPKRRGRPPKKPK